MYSNTPRVTQILPHYDFTSLRLYVIHFNELHASINKIYVVGDPVYDHGWRRFLPELEHRADRATIDIGTPYTLEQTDKCYITTWYVCKIQKMPSMEWSFEKLYNLVNHVLLWKIVLLPEKKWQKTKNYRQHTRHFRCIFTMLPNSRVTIWPMKQHRTCPIHSSTISCLIFHYVL